MTFLGRPAQGGEERGFVNALLQGQSEEQVLSILLGSSEFYNRAQTLASADSPDGNYVEALYRLLLGRPTGPGEAAGWLNALPQLGRGGVALAIEGSAEYRTDVVVDYYETLLHRLPDAAGVSGWIFSNLDLSTVRVGIESGREFLANG